jgi:trans-aconitate methyltransferase
MPIDDESHLHRDHAESFGAVAADYDRFRPSYPAQLIDDLAALRPAAVLDIGCGTGKAATLLAGRGLDVLGVEPDAAMAEVARSHGIDVEVGHFETWADAGRRFDLITCAQAWHWIEPHRGAARAAQLLRPGRTLALFWNYDHDTGEAQPFIEAAYASAAPELGRSVGAGTSRRDHRPYADELRRSGAFADVTTRTYEWTRLDTVQDWIARTATHSDHLALDPQRRAELVTALRRQLRDVGTQVHVRGGTYVVLATTPRG